MSLIDNTNIYTLAEDVLRKTKSEIGAYKLAINRLQYDNAPSKEGIINAYNFNIQLLTIGKKTAAEIVEYKKNVEKSNDKPTQKQRKLEMYASLRREDGTLDRLLFANQTVPHEKSDEMKAKYFDSYTNNNAINKSNKHVKFADDDSLVSYHETYSNATLPMDNTTEISDDDNIVPEEGYAYDRTSIITRDKRRQNRKDEFIERMEHHNLQDEKIQPFINELTNLYHQYRESESLNQAKNDSASAAKQKEVYNNYIDYRNDNLPLGVDENYLNSQLNAAYSAKFQNYYKHQTKPIQKASSVDAKQSSDENIASEKKEFTIPSERLDALRPAKKLKRNRSNSGFTTQNDTYRPNTNTPTTDKKQKVPANSNGTNTITIPPRTTSRGPR